MNKKTVFTLIFLLANQAILAQDLELLEQEDLEILKEPDTVSTSKINLSKKEELDDLESLRQDLGELNINEDVSNDLIPEIEAFEKEAFRKTPFDDTVESGDTNVANRKVLIKKRESVNFFDVGAEERKLLEVAKIIENKMPNTEWNEIASAAQKDSYQVIKGDTLWDISRTLFGSGFYYPKVWSLNSFITNPHEIEPGMVLNFTLGSSEQVPEVKLGAYTLDPSVVDDKVGQSSQYKDLTQYAENATPEWISQREGLLKSGVYVQYANEYSYEDLKAISETSLIKEYENYSPPVADISLEVPDTYDDTGFDKESKISFKFKEGFHLNTFISSNIVQDFGEIDASPQYREILSQGDTIYVKFDPELNISPGERYSIYTSLGKVNHKLSEREGNKYVINAEIVVKGQKNHLWECEITNSTEAVKRGDRVTVYTPRIDKILKTFNRQNIEAIVVAGYNDDVELLASGSVVYLDRGRADGVELGNVFEAYSFLDRSNNRRITPDPTYKIGELRVISLTDNFATALVTTNNSAIRPGTIAITKTYEQALRDKEAAKSSKLKSAQEAQAKALDELDVELNVNNLTKDLLKKADQIELTEDELEELERQERAKSVIKDHERDLKELARLEREIETAELLLNEERTDKDKLLENQDLNSLEKGLDRPSPDAFESLNEIEQEIGKKYLDEDLNAKENPYGLTEFDIEEIDELLNTGAGIEIK